MSAGSLEQRGGASRLTLGLGLLGWLVLCFGAAALGSWATTPELPGWYASLRKPSFNPPNWVFGPVWTVLFALMAVAAWLVWKRAGWGGGRAALGAFLVQLGLNTLWSWLFFGRHAIGAAAVEIVILWLAILATAVLFARVDRRAGWMLAPYLAWVGYATVLNIAIWRLNSG